MNNDKSSGAKLSWCQIVRFELLVPNCMLLTLGAKLSSAIQTTHMKKIRITYSRAQTKFLFQYVGLCCTSWKQCGKVCISPRN